jgi:hypothetical protein
MSTVKLIDRDDAAAQTSIEMLEAAGSTGVRQLIANVDGRRYSVIVSRDPIPAAWDVDPRWHVSVAGESDVPKWRHLVAIAHAIRPGVCFVVGVPPRSWWINVHPHCLHLWEVKDTFLTDQWRAEALGQVPS